MIIITITLHISLKFQHSLSSFISSALPLHVISDEPINHVLGRLWRIRGHHMARLVHHCPPQVTMHLCSTNPEVGALDFPCLFLGFLPVSESAPVHPGDPTHRALSVHYKIVLSIIKHNFDVVEQVFYFSDLGLHNIVIESIVNSHVA